MGESFSEAMKPVVYMLHFIGKYHLANALINLGVVLTLLNKNGSDEIAAWREELEAAGRGEGTK